MKQGEIFVAAELGEPVVHCSNDRHDSVAAVAHQIPDFFLFDLLGRFAGAMNQLHVKRDKCIARIANQKDDPGPGQFPCRNEVFAPDSIPEPAFHSLLRKIVRKNEPRDSWIVIMLRFEGERPARSFAKIGAEKRADPSPPTFWHGDDNCVAAGKLSGPAAKVPSVERASSDGGGRSPGMFGNFPQNFYIALGERFQRIPLLD